MTCLELKIHTLEKSHFFTKKYFNLQVFITIANFFVTECWLCLNNQLFLTSSTIKIDDIDKNHAMLWELCYSFYLMDGILVCQAIPYFSALISSETMDTRPLAKNKDVLCESLLYALLFAQYGPTFVGSARIDPWNRSCER